MRFIIFSDSHGSLSNMREAVRRNIAAGLDGIIFLGDGLRSARELADESGLTLYAVAGNCDFGADIDSSRLDTYEKLLEFDGVKVFITHGHKFMVKSTGAIINKYALSKGADIVLYGHTHYRNDNRIPASDANGERELRVFNPGSIALPPDGVNSFGLMEIRNGIVYLSHGEI